jgi:hypothetical protein
MNRAASLWLLSFLVLTAAACSGTSDGIPGVLEPCSDPAPLTGNPNPKSLGYTVELQAGTDPGAEVRRIASEYGVAIDQVHQGGDSFVSQLDVIQLGCVRCDPQVKSVFGNMVLDPL